MHISNKRPNPSTWVEIDGHVIKQHKTRNSINVCLRRMGVSSEHLITRDQPNTCNRCFRVGYLLRSKPQICYECWIDSVPKDTDTVSYSDDTTEIEQ